jgi:hypothetical protein
MLPAAGTLPVRLNVPSTRHRQKRARPPPHFRAQLSSRRSASDVGAGHGSQCLVKLSSSPSVQSKLHLSTLGGRGIQAGRCHRVSRPIHGIGSSCLRLRQWRLGIEIPLDTPTADDERFAPLCRRRDFPVLQRIDEASRAGLSPGGDEVVWHRVAGVRRSAVARLNRWAREVYP